jgi:uncharacterized protein (DUF1501 family)
MGSGAEHRGCSCEEFNRAELLRRGVAKAGRGLPAIEAGMPVPAGTGLSRRGFLLASAGLALSVYGAERVLDLSRFEEGVATAAAASPSEPVLVSVYLQGGIDSMSVLYPAGESLYAKYRPVLALPASAGPTFAEDPRLHWHPQAAPLAQLHGEGKLSVLPAVGYSHPDESHFTSRHFWEVGATQADLLTGWMGRYLDLTGTNDNPLQGLCLDSALQPALATAKVPVATIQGPSSFSLLARGVGGAPFQEMLGMVDTLGYVGVQSGDPSMAQSGDAALAASVVRSQLAPFQPAPGAPALALPAGYPVMEDRFPARLADVAELLAAGMPLRCVTVTTESVFDTHNNQAERLNTGLGEAVQSLYAFQRDLEARGLADRVLTLVWSEFGRRAHENDSAGTDHGAAGCAFVMGTQAAGAMVGEWPGLAKGLDPLGNVKATSDFRSLYCSLLEQWLGFEAAGVIPGAGRLGRVRVVG